MAVIRTFKAVRPHKKVAGLVASVPYDVVNKEEAAELAKDNPINFLRVTRSEIELSKNTDPYSEEVYLKAKEIFNRIREEAPLVQDETPHFYVYRLKMGNHSQVGIAATFSVEDYDNDVIMKHEKTRRVKEDDRTNHITITGAQTGAVFLTYRGIDEINGIVNETMETEPLYDFTSPDGIKHTMWIMPSDYHDVVQFEIGKVDKLYIADGHHRAASSSRAQKVMKEKNPNHTGDEEYNYFLAVLFPAEQLKIMPYNRVVFDLKGIDNDQFRELVKKYFDIADTDDPNPPNKGVICMYQGGKWYRLTPNSSVVPGNAVGDKLDVSILQNFLLHPILDIDDPRTNENIDFIGGIRGTDELEKLVTSGKAAVAFSLYPVEVDDLIRISNAGETMPPKSTWFEPKLRDGLVVHLI
ncbi:MAG: DUF1015 domain-containing protein [Melioribacteraceae bacterium]|nr:DUF1015 domain-containing protein [Melioribacteraceae bacterium]